MRLRRMLAFVLTLAMVMGNVTPAYASEIPTENGITYTTDEDGNIVITNNAEENQQETPENGDADSEETNGDNLQDDSNTPDGQIPDGEANSNGNEVFEGSETPDGNEVPEGNVNPEGSEVPKEEETEESLSDNSLTVSENTLPVMLDEGEALGYIIGATLDSNYNSQYDEENQLSFSDWDVLETTLKEQDFSKYDFLEIRVNHEKRETPISLENKNLNLNCESVNNVYLVVYGTVAVKGDSKIIVNDIGGTATFALEQEATLSLMPAKNKKVDTLEPVSLYIYSGINFTFAEDGSSWLILGDKSMNPGDRVFLYECNIDSPAANVKLIGNVADNHSADEYWVKIASGEKDEDYLTRGNNLKTLEIEAICYENAWGNYFSQAKIGIPISVESLILDGWLNGSKITAKNTQATVDSRLYVGMPSNLGQLTVLPKNGSANQFDIYMIQWKKDSELLGNGQVVMEGVSVEKAEGLSPAINFTKLDFVYMNNRFQQDKVGAFAEGEVIATVNSNMKPEDGTFGVSREYWDSSEQMAKYRLEIEADTENQGQYLVKAYKNYSAAEYKNAVATVEGRPFATLTDVKSYIEEKDAEDSSFGIELRKAVTVTPGELDYSDVKAKVSVYTKGNTLTLNGTQTISVDDLWAGTYPNGKLSKKGTISLGQNASVTISPKGNNWCGIGDAIITGTTANLTAGSTEESKATVGISFNNVTANVKNLNCHGNVNWDEASSINVSGTLTLKGFWGNEAMQRTDFYGAVTTQNLDAAEGCLYAVNLNVKGTAAVSTGREFAIGANGKAVFKDIHVRKADESEIFNLTLEQEIKLQAFDTSGKAYAKYTREELNTFFYNRENDKNLVYKDAEKLSQMGSVQITGKVTTETDSYIFAGKNYCWILPTDKNYTETYSWTADFDNGEDFAIVNANVSVADFQIDDMDGTACVRKYTDAKKTVRLQMAKKSISVGYVEDYDENGPIINRWVDYANMEDAVVGITSDFQNLYGEYFFCFLEDITLEKDVTIPNCVTNLQLISISEDAEEGAVPVGDYQKVLNLNGHTLSSNASFVTLAGGLRITGGENTQGTFNLNNNNYTTLYVVDEGTLLDAQQQVLTGENRMPVLNNVKVVSAKGNVNLYTKPDYGQNLGNTSFHVNAMEIQRGKWICKEVVTTNLAIWREQFEEPVEEQGDLFEDAVLEAEKITANVGGVVVVDGILGNSDWQNNHLALTLNQAKLQITETGKCYLDSFTAAKAYAADSMGDATVENCGTWYVSTLDMKAGTLVNFDCMLVKNVTNVKDFQNYGSLITNTFNQMNGSKTYLAGASRLLINETGTIYQVNLGSKDGYDSEAPVLGLGAKETEAGETQIAAVAIKGTFTANAEEQKLHIAVTGAYTRLEELTGDKIWFYPYTYDGEIGETKIPLITLENNSPLFTTDHKAFPTEHILVLPEYQLESDGFTPVKNPQGEPIPNLYSSAKQYMNKTTNQIQVAGECIEVSVVYDNGTENVLRSFSDLQTAISYLKNIGNKNTSYILNLRDPEAVVEGALNLPSNIGSLTIRGEEAGTVLFCTGNMSLTCDTTLENLALSGIAALDTKGFGLIMKNASAEFETIKGTAATVAELTNSFLSLTKTTPVTGLGELRLEDSQLRMGRTNLTVTHLVLKSTKPEMMKKASIEAGKVTITDIDVVGEGNTLHCAGLEIKGDLTSYDVDGKEDNRNAYADPVWENAFGEESQKPLCYNLRATYEELADKVNYKIVKKNAINLCYNGSGEVTENTQLAITAKVPSYWFVYNRYNKNGNDLISNVTRKEINTIKYGPKQETSGDVVELAKIFSAETESGNETYSVIDTYDSLQKAFDEIDRLADSKAEYRILLKDNVGSEKADLKFPAKAEKIFIVGEVEDAENPEAKTVTFKKTAQLNCDVEFKNICFDGVNAASELKLGSWEAVLNGSYVEDSRTAADIFSNLSIIGSGMGKGSRLLVVDTVEDNPLMVIHLKDVDTVIVKNANMGVSKTLTNVSCFKLQSASVAVKETVTLKDVETYGDSCMLSTVLSNVKWNDAEEITALTNNLTISGTVSNYPSEEGKDDAGVLYIGLAARDAKGSYAEDMLTEGSFSKELIESNKAVLVKSAPKVSFDTLEVYNFDMEHLYKKSGSIIYKDTEAQVMLAYEAERNGETVSMKIPCETFADAVAEINSLKTKQAYEIYFVNTEKTLEAPTVLTMPNKNYVESLLLTTEGTEENRLQVGYLGDLNFTCHVLLSKIDFVQMTKTVTAEGETVYKPVDEVKEYPAIVNVKTGGSDIRFADVVTFNTPVAFNGGKKGCLFVDNSATVQAGTAATLENIEEDATYIQGKITDFAEMEIAQPITVEGWQTVDNKQNVKDNAAELKAVTLTLQETANVLVGSDTNTGSVVNATNLNLNGSDLKVYGNADFKNVTLTGDAPELTVLGQKFNITGLLTSTAEKPVLTGTINTKLEPVLTISGTAVLQDAAANRIQVKVVDAEGDAVRLGTATGETDAKGNEIYYSSHLLQARAIKETVFDLHTDSTKGESESMTGASKEFDAADNQNGYFLKKNGNYVEVHYGDEVEAVLYTVTDSETGVTKSMINAYQTLNEAVTAVKNLNDVTAEYEILLLKSQGSETAPYKLPVPEKAAKVTFTGKGGIWVYNANSITQKTDIAFENITVVNTGSWNGGKYQLDVINADVTIQGKTTVSALKLKDGGRLTLNGVSTLTDIIYEYSASKISGGEVDGSWNRLTVKAGNLTVKGRVTNRIPAAVHEIIKTLQLHVTGAEELKKTDILDKSKADIGDSYLLSNQSKLVVLEKESMEKIRFFAGGTDIQGRTAWASKGIYYLPTDYAYGVNVTLISGETRTTTCLDMAEAANYINTMADKTASYQVSLSRDITDTKVTDKAAVSPLTLPNKDKAASVTVGTVEDAEQKTITFTGDLKVNGEVTMENLKLENPSSYNITMDKNSDVKNGKDIQVGASSLTLSKVDAGNHLKNISGKKGVSQVELNHNAALTLSGGITNVAQLTLKQQTLTTKARSEVQKLVILTEGIWNTEAATTLGDVMLDELATGTEGMNTYISTRHGYNNKKVSTGIPQLIITGKIMGESKLPIKLSEYVKDENEAYVWKEVTDYCDAKLVLAKSESADRFVAYGYAKATENQKGFEIKDSDIAAYKDKSNYVSNGNLADKQVILSQLKDGTPLSSSYVATYGEAIDIINNTGDKTADYKITLLHGAVSDTGYDSTICTAAGGKLGALALPKSGKAASLTIEGKHDENITLRFTGAVQANCNLTFENVTLEEVSVVKTEVKYAASGITLKPNSYQVEFGNGCKVKTSETDTSGDLTFKTIDGTKGTVSFAENSTVVVNEKLKVKEIGLLGDGSVSLIGKKEINITDITKNGDSATLTLTTYYNQKPWMRNATQLTIGGEVESGIALKVIPMIYDAETKQYVELNEDQSNQLLIFSYATPQGYQKVANASKMLTENVQLADNEEAKAVKYNGGLYFTSDDLSVEVSGYNADDTFVYRAQFFTWEQAVKEIDNLKHTDWRYEIELRHVLGEEIPLPSVPMPSKAKEIVINGLGKGIVTTASSISLKCPTVFRESGLYAVKKTGNKYYGIPLTLNVGSYEMRLYDIVSEITTGSMGMLSGEWKISGNAKGSVTCNTSLEGNSLISQITNVGEVVLEFDSASGIADYEIAGGMKGIKNLTLAKGVNVNAGKSEVSVTNLTIGNISGQTQNINGKEEVTENTRRSSLRAKNIAVTGTTTMASAALHAGTTTIGDGKITLQNVVFKDRYNCLEGKQDKNGNSLINIKGTVISEADYPGWQAASIVLYLNNSVQRKAQLSEGMTLVNAPKAAASLFAPDYHDGEYKGMGPRITGTVIERDENGEPKKENGQEVTYEADLYGFYKSGNFVKYGKVRQVEDGNEIPQNEVRLWIGTNTTDTDVWDTNMSIEFATFEEAVKAVDTMSLYKDAAAKNKVYEEYVIELLQDVHIGNEKNDGKYKPMTLPSKSSALTIAGNGNTIYESGNVTLKCNTEFCGVTLAAYRTVKKEAVPSAINVVVGNYTMSVRDSYFGFADNEEWISCVNKVSGSAKGCLVLWENSYFEADEITGIKVEFAGNGENYLMDDNGTPNEESDDTPIESILIVNKNFAASELKYRNYAYGTLISYGKVTVNDICTVGENIAQILVEEGTQVQLKGITRTLADKTKINGSIFFDTVEKDGAQLKTDEIALFVISKAEGTSIPAGTKVITGKYLNPEQWTVKNVVENNKIEARKIYMNGSNLYLGAKL